MTSNKISKVFWGFDSEFFKSGRVNRPEDTQLMQFSNGDKIAIIESSSELKNWLSNHKTIKAMYAFNLLPELGSLISWLGAKCLKAKYVGAQLQVRLKYGSFSCTIYDMQPLLNSLGLYKLEQCGQVVGLPKLAKPLWLGMRNWQNDREHKEFVDYSSQDALITSKIAQWLYDNFGIDAAETATSGTWAKREFHLPKHLQLKNRLSVNRDTGRLNRSRIVEVPPLERMIKNSCFAGRSECFVNGFTKDAFYNDIKSQYPTSISATRALQIVGAKQCDKDQVVIGDPERFGWLEGTFESNNDIWGLPLRGKNNFLATGTLNGVFHSFDLAAAKAKPIHITRAIKPIFGDDTSIFASSTDFARCKGKRSKIHDKYVDLLLRRIDGKLGKIESMGAKAVLNSTYGKIGQARGGIAQTSNFFAYSTILAHSHYMLSMAFDKSETPVLGCDTDSVFTQSDISGSLMTLTDGENSIPVKLENKGIGDLVYFRAKQYIMFDKKQQDAIGDNIKNNRAVLHGVDQSKLVYGIHSWHCFKEDYFRLFFGDVTQMSTRKDIKHTLETKVKEALKLEIGRWQTKPVTLDLEKIKHLVKADSKRQRTIGDSYGLVMSRKSSPSRAYSIDYLLETSDDSLDWPKIIKPDEW